jgi:hypothetical protein
MVPSSMPTTFFDVVGTSLLSTKLTQGCGEDVVPRIIEVLHRYDIMHRLGFTTVDSATANEKVCWSTER